MFRSITRTKACHHNHQNTLAQLKSQTVENSTALLLRYRRRCHRLIAQNWFQKLSLLAKASGHIKCVIGKNWKEPNRRNITALCLFRSLLILANNRLNCRARWIGCLDGRNIRHLTSSFSDFEWLHIIFDHINGACEQFFWMFCNPASLHTASIQKKILIHKSLIQNNIHSHKATTVTSVTNTLFEAKQFAIMVYYKSSNREMREEHGGKRGGGGAALIECASMTSIKERFDGFHELIIIITNDVIHTHSLCFLVGCLWVCSRCAYLFRWHWKLWDYYMIFSSRKFSCFSRSLALCSFYPRCLLIISNELAYTLWVHSLIRATFSSHFVTLSMMADWLLSGMAWQIYEHTNMEKHWKVYHYVQFSLCVSVFVSVWVVGSFNKGIWSTYSLERLDCSCCEIVCHKNKFIFLLCYEWKTRENRRKKGQHWIIHPLWKFTVKSDVVSWLRMMILSGWDTKKALNKLLKLPSFSWISITTISWTPQ